MLTRRSSAFFAALFCLVAASAVAAPVRLVSGPDYVPFADPNLPSGGLAGALVLAAFASADIAVEPVQYEPWKRGYADVLAGQFDATFPYVRSKQREAEMLFSDPIYDIVTVALFPADSGRDYSGPDSLKGLTLCLPIGYAPAPPLVPLIEAGAIRIQQPGNPDLCLKELASGRVDVFVNNGELIDLRAPALFGPAPPFVRGHIPVDRQALYLVAPRAAPGAADLVDRFNKGLAAIRADGRYEAIVRRQLGAS